MLINEQKLCKYWRLGQRNCNAYSEFIHIGINQCECEGIQCAARALNAMREQFFFVCVVFFWIRNNYCAHAKRNARPDRARIG